jgi:hypothetical protein
LKDISTGQPKCGVAILNNFHGSVAFDGFRLTNAKDKSNWELAFKNTVILCTVISLSSVY